jgi:phosphoribosylformylglycinamidine synthase PurS subunit
MFPMKVRVFVSPKTTVLDPQGQAIRSALHSLGYAAVADVRQGKLFELDIADSQAREQTMLDVKTIAHEILANPVIEEYRIELLD